MSKTIKAKPNKIKVKKVNKEQLYSERECTCGSGELAYLCNGNGEEGWAYCG